MALTLNDVRDLTQLLALHPEWRAEVRRLVLTDELLELPGLVHNLAAAQLRTEAAVHDLVEAQQRTEARLEQLAEAQRRTEARLEQLAEAQRRTEARLERLEAVVQELAEAQRQMEARLQRLEAVVHDLAEAQRQMEARLQRLEAVVHDLAEAQQRTEARLEQLAEAQRQMEARLQRLEAVVQELAEAQRRTEATVHELVKVQQRFEMRLQRLEDRMSKLEGRDLERHYREKVGVYLGRWLWPVRAISPAELRETLEARLDESQVEDVMNLDVLIEGRARWRPDKPQVWLAMEVSSVVDRNDVKRAQRRAALLREAGYRAIPAVAGERLTEGAEGLAKDSPIIIVEDGRSRGWERFLADETGA